MSSVETLRWISFIALCFLHRGEYCIVCLLGEEVEESNSVKSRVGMARSTYARINK